MSDEARQACGRRLREAREGRGLTQAALAALVGVSQPSLHEWETGRSQPAFENRRRLAETMGFDPYAIDVPTPAEGAA